MDELIIQALKGQRQALEAIVKEIREDIYNLAIRFLWVKEDAEDATQEILVKVITNLAMFEAKSKFSTWVYRIAVNHLLNLKKGKLEQSLTFSEHGEDLIEGLASPGYHYPDRDLLTEEIKIGCTLGMLLCLNRNLRVAYILGEVFELNSYQAGEILGITPENFRKRLSQARKVLKDFMHAYCGLTNKANPCRCDKRINYAISKGRVNSKQLLFVTPELLSRSKTEMEGLYSTPSIFKSHPLYTLDPSKGDQILKIIDGLKYLTTE